MQTYSEILAMVIKACDTHFYTGTKDIHKEILESATKIYIKKMELDFEKKRINNDL